MFKYRLKHKEWETEKFKYEYYKEKIEKYMIVISIFYIIGILIMYYYLIKANLYDNYVIIIKKKRNRFRGEVF